jgi:hypothetical protein
MRLTREPVALVQALLVPIFLAVILALPLGGDLSGALNAVVTGVGGLVAAWGVQRWDAVLPILGGFAKSVIALILAFGIHLAENYQTLILSVVSIIVAYLTRPQVEAKASAKLTAARTG